MAKYIDIFTDYGFKKIFGEEANKNILIDFLNALLPNACIRDLTFKNSEQLPPRIEERKAVYDIYCENDKGEKFIVELQKAKQNYFIERTIYYSTFPIMAQAQKGEWNYNLNAVYCVGLLDFRFSDYKNDEDKREVVHTHTIKNQHNRQVYDKLTYIYLEMPNFKKTEAELATRLDKWLYFIKNLENFQAIPEIFKNEVVFSEAIEKAEIARMTERELSQYNIDLKIYRDNISRFNTAKEDGKEEGREEGFKIGREEGKKEGIEEGIEEGLKKGREEARREMFNNMIKNGISIEILANVNGLSIAEVKKIISG